ncbi:MAG: tetratricopeptide repeat protein [Desulfobacterales bacterium]
MKPYPESYLNALRETVRGISLVGHPSEALKNDVAELSENLEVLELYGIELRMEDYVGRAAHLFFQGNYAPALQSLEKAISLNPAAAALWIHKGMLLIRLGRLSEALLAAQKAVGLDPRSAAARTCQAQALEAAQRFREALAAVEAGIACDPGYAPGWALKSGIACRLGRYDEGLAAGRQALVLDAANPAACYNLACLFALKGEVRQALLHLERAIVIDPACRLIARRDEDLAILKDTPEFRRLTA